jgi:hypothetical protein
MFYFSVIAYDYILERSRRGRARTRSPFTKSLVGQNSYYNHNHNYNYNQKRRLNKLAVLVVTYPQASRGDS